MNGKHATIEDLSQIFIVEQHEDNQERLHLFGYYVGNVLWSIYPHLMRQKILLCFHCSNNPLFKRQSSSRHILLLSPSYLFGSTLVVCSYTPSRSNHRTLYSTPHN